MDPDEVDRILAELFGEGQMPYDGKPPTKQNMPYNPGQDEPRRERLSEQPQPPNVPDWLWQRYLAANREYDEVWEDLKNSGGLDEFGLEKKTDPALQTRAANARSLLASIIAQIDNYMPKQTAAVDPEDAALKRRLLAAQVASAERGPLGPQRAPQTAEELEYDKLRNEELSRKLAGTLEPSDWDKANTLYTRGQAEAKTAYDKSQDELERARLAQTLEMQRREAATRAWSEMLNTRMKAASSALIPGQQYFLGYQPGGAAENIAKMWGNSYNPEVYRVPVVNYDENDAWRQAWDRMGGR